MKYNFVAPLKQKRNFLQPFFTSCEHDCFCFKKLKHFRFKRLRRFLKIKMFWFFKTVLGIFKTSFEKFTMCSIDLLLLFLEIEIIKANQNHINISLQKCKYIDSCFNTSFFCSIYFRILCLCSTIFPEFGELVHNSVIQSILPLILLQLFHIQLHSRF